MTSTLKRTERTMPLRELTGATAAPIATVFANLMPPEVIAKRRLGWLKRRLAFALVALVALVGLGYALVRQQTAGVEDALHTEQARTGLLSADVRKFDDLLGVQTRIESLRSQLRVVMTTDLRWSRLLSTLNAAAPAGLAVDQVAGELADPGAAAAATTPGSTGLNDPQAAQTIGTITLSGTARDYRTVARYVDTLAKVVGLVQVDPGSVTSGTGRSTFTVTASLTKDVLGGRFTRSGGK